MNALEIGIALTGLASGAVYALIALALSLSFRSAGLVNIAQGDLAVLAAYLGAKLFMSHGVPYWPSMAVVAVTMGLVMALLDRTVFWKLYAANISFLVLVTTGLSFFIESLLTVAWGGSALTYPSVFGNGVLRIGSVRVPTANVVVLVASLIIAGLLALGMSRTALGRSIRAAAIAPGAAETCGIPVARNRTVALVVSGVLSGVAGMLIAPLIPLYPSTGLDLLLLGFVPAVVGGFGSMAGAVVASLILGAVTSVSASYVSSELSTMLPYLVLIIILIFRPSGLFGEEGVGIREV